MWKIPDSQPDELVHVDRPEIEHITPHPDVLQPRKDVQVRIGGWPYP